MPTNRRWRRRKPRSARGTSSTPRTRSSGGWRPAWPGIITGKNKPEWTPHVDCGDHVVVINAAKVKVTGRKLEQKVYHRHTGYPGGLKDDHPRQAARREARARHRARRPRHVPEGDPRAPDGDQAQGLRRARAPARGPEAPGRLAPASTCQGEHESDGKHPDLQHGPAQDRRGPRLAQAGRRVDHREFEGGRGLLPPQDPAGDHPAGVRGRQRR